jgi:hypothetical protein
MPDSIHIYMYIYIYKGIKEKISIIKPKLAIYTDVR